jgi:predicted nucleotidyltransferase
MTADEYLKNILVREAVDVSSTSPVLQVQKTLQPLLTEWAGAMLRGVHPSGSFVKGTANRSGTDIDLFVSLSNNVTETLKEIYTKLFDRLKEKGYSPKQQNVSINIRVGGYDVDLVPAKHQGGTGEDHSLYRRRADTWTKTNVLTHIAKVQGSNRASEIKVIKLWRDQKGLDFPSFYLELAVLAALAGKGRELSNNVWSVFQYLKDTFPTARFVDPANSNNIISDDLSAAERAKIKAEAEKALAAPNWNQIVV